ncbi:D-xylose ABC transporter ATP-binding protein [Anaerolineaceae bacterium oral taxon 439]|nr:D-xylose ABC transporter ATP-binding protein [Anaerolineaceae bacterium oral taxon 439]
MSQSILIEVDNITKCFPGTIALDHVHFKVRKGSVHAICGENGAGKSTLMNIIGGVFLPTEGTIFFEGNQVSIRRPKDAQDLGISFVHQELILCEELTIAENIFIGRLPKRYLAVDYVKLFDQANRVLERFSVPFTSERIVSSLNVSEKQIVEIAKAISLKSKLLILDEPTSSLSEKETKKLFDIIRSLKEEGLSILYISHRMAEIFEICDRVTILRDGKIVKEKNISDTCPDEVIQCMVGRALTDMYPEKNINSGEELLRVENLSNDGFFSNISFRLFKGEILGFAGLVGAGRSEIMRSLCSIDSKTSGSVFLNQESISFERYCDCIRNGIVYLTEDRKSEGLFLEMSVKNNISVVDLKNISDDLIIRKRKEDLLTAAYCSKLGIKTASIDSKASSLSGGNQQKVVISKWLAVNPKIIILDEPTRGIDVGAKSEIHKLLRELASAGIGIIIISSELPEVIGLCDRVIVIHEGRISGQLLSNQFSEESILRLASGEISIK